MNLRKYFLIIGTLIVFLGYASIARAYVYQGYHWHAEKTRFRYASSLPESMKTPTYYGQQKTWDDGSPSTHYFQYDSASSNEIKYVYVDGAYAYGGITNARTRCSWNAKKHLTDCDLEYDKDESWHTDVNSSPPASKFDAWNVAAHEFGHFLKLGHSGLSDATMYKDIQGGETKKRSLATDDKDGIWAIYDTTHTASSLDLDTQVVGSSIE